MLGLTAAVALVIVWKAAGSSGSSPGGSVGGYWSTSCVTGDERTLVAGGDHAALIDLSSGKIVDRIPAMVKAIGCSQSQALVVGYDKAWALPEKTELTQVPVVNGDVIGLGPGGEWISAVRKTSGGRWKGPPTLFVAGKGEARQTDLPPARFGKIGAARPLPTADTFAVRLGNLVEDGRLVVACGWQPSQSGGVYEDVPWGFFAVDLKTGEAAALTLPLKSDPALNQNWLQKIAASPDAMHLVVAAHDGTQIAVAQFDQGANAPSRVTQLPAQGSVSAVAISDDGTWVAVGSESRGRDAKAVAWVINQAGKTIWSGEFEKTIVGLHFLLDDSLIVASAEAVAVRVALPAGTEKWRTP